MVVVNDNGKESGSVCAQAKRSKRVAPTTRMFEMKIRYRIKIVMFLKKNVGWSISFDWDMTIKIRVECDVILEWAWSALRKIRKCDRLWVVVAEWLARWTCDCEVPGSNRARRKVYHATVLGQYCICTKTHALGQPSLSSLRGRQIGSKLGSWRQRVIFRLLVAAVVCLRVKWDGHSVSGESVRVAG